MSRFAHVLVIGLTLGVFFGGGMLGCSGAEITVEPGDDLQAALVKVAESGTIVFGPGVYSVTQPLEVSKSGVTLKASQPRAARLVVADDFKSPGPVLRINRPNVTIDGLVLDGQFRRLTKAIRAPSPKETNEPGAGGLIIHNCEIYHFAHHAVDVDADDSIVRNCAIYQIMWNDAGERKDAHGIVTTNAKGMLIENCDIYQCSGDCIQGERGVWNDLRIVNCDLWDAPLQDDMGGFEQGSYVSENAIDTKHRGSQRDGFRTPLIPHPSALVLKENVDVVVDGCDVYDSKIGFRLRGISKGKTMRVALINCVVRDNDAAFRLEDRLQNFRMYHCTMHENHEQIVWAPRRKRWWGRTTPTGWSNVNNLWIGARSLPEISESARLGAQNNLILAADDVDQNLIPLRTAEAIEVPPLVDKWYASTSRVEKDKNGIHRRPVSTVGAIEAKQ
jgi:hypothetical protein